MRAVHPPRGFVSFHESQNTKREQRYSPDPDQRPPDRRILFAGLGGEICNREQKESFQHQAAADLETLGAYFPFASQPRRHKQSEQRRLRPVAQKKPTGECSDCPQKNAVRPMFLKIEDLRRQENPGAYTYGPYGVKRYRQSREAFRHESAGDWKRRHKQQNQTEAPSRR